MSYPTFNCFSLLTIRNEKELRFRTLNIRSLNKVGIKKEITVRTYQIRKDLEIRDWVKYKKTESGVIETAADFSNFFIN